MLVRAKPQAATQSTQPVFNRPVEDNVLWENLRKGNELAFSILYKRYVQRLYNYGMHMCGRKHIVLDALQEMFARIWAKRDSLADARFVNHYLFKSFRRLLVGKLAKSRRFRFFTLDHSDIFDFVPSFEESLIETERRAEQYKRLRTSVSELTRRQREAIFLKFYSELSYAEVAAIMELHQDSVYNLISKAIERLRKKLDFFPVLLCCIFL
jgi:RNA polymerase sigma factor (sigma-70 family)